MSNVSPLPPKVALALATDPRQLQALRHASFAKRSPTTFPLGTRASQLALIQTEMVAAALNTLHPEAHYTFPVTPMSVLGDRNKDDPLYLLTTSSSTAPAKSLWTEELELALLAGEVDMIVHSLKDVPTQLPEGCELGAILVRADPRDALVVKKGLEYKTLGDMPDGSVIGTSSVRRIAQMKRTYPKLEVKDVRGNLDTRFRKLDDPSGPYTALILASAGVSRMSLSSRITSPLHSLPSAGGMYHAVGQGAVAIEIRSDDERIKAVLRGVGDWKTEWQIACERGLLRELEGGCSVPVGVETELLEVEGTQEGLESPFSPPLPPPTAKDPLIYLSGQGKSASLNMSACVTSMDGTKQVVHAPGAVLITSWSEAREWGVRIAKEIKALGAKEILDEINEVRREREEGVVNGKGEAVVVNGNGKAVVNGSK